MTGDRPDPHSYSERERRFHNACIELYGIPPEKYVLGIIFVTALVVTVAGVMLAWGIWWATQTPPSGAIRPATNVYTAVYDGHNFIMWYGQMPTHHPDCPCQKLTEQQ